MKTINVEIRGTSPLLIHRFSEASEHAKPTRRQIVNVVNPREEATRCAYIAPDGTFYFSAFSIPAAMGNAGASHKMRGTRKTLRFVVPSAVRVCCDTITILNGHSEAPATNTDMQVESHPGWDVIAPAHQFEVDSRPVNIPATKGRVMRHRPRFDHWGARFQLLLDDNQLDVDTAHLLLTEAGQSIGIGDFRPEKRGPFGTFRVTEFKEQDGGDEATRA